MDFFLRTTGFIGFGRLPVQILNGLTDPLLEMIKS